MLISLLAFKAFGFFICFFKGLIEKEKSVMCDIVTHDVFNYMLKHMLDIHDQKMSLVSCYSIEYDAYMKMLTSLKDYISRIEKFLESAQIQNGLNQLPFVIFGSQVYLTERNSGEGIICSVVLPNDPRYGKHMHNGVKIIDCCSLSADNLIYKCVGDTVKLKLDAQYQELIIKSIEEDANMPISKAI